MSTFPSVLSTFVRPSENDKLNSPSHSALHNSVSSILGQVEAVIGVDGVSSVVGTMMYDLRSPASGGGGHVQTANKGGTGQTSFNKGDILVAQSSSVLTKLAVGTDSQALVADSTTATGIKWGSGMSKPTVRVYGYSSSVITWNKPSVLSYVIVEVVGGGGGGGGCNNDQYGANGGGGGGYSRKVITPSILGTTENIVIGIGGAAGAAAGGTGGTGGTTGFGTSSILYATGGAGGTEANASGGVGGVGIGGDINAEGSDGGTGDKDTASGTNANSGYGGSSPLGGGGGSVGVTGSSNSAGSDGNLYGGGGSGGVVTDSGTATGGAGAAGVCIVTEY